MSCAIEDGYEIDCNKDSLGGLSKVMIAAKNDVESVTGADGSITAIKMKTGKQFFNFALVKSTSNFTDTITSNPTNGSVFYAEAMTLVFNRLKAATSKMVDDLARSSVVAIVTDRNGELVMLGREHGLDVSGGTAGSGTAGGDRNGYELQFSGEEKMISHVDPTLIAALLIPATA